MGIRSNDHQRVGGKQFFEHDVQFNQALVGGKKEVIRQSADSDTALTLNVDQSGAIVLLDEDEAYTITLPAITS